MRRYGLGLFGAIRTVREQRQSGVREPTRHGFPGRPNGRSNVDNYILEMKGITKTFPGVKALSDVNINVRPGTIHALVGENGAGKSTLINIISGVYPYGTYEGSYMFGGREMRFRHIREVEREGIACIHQELNLAPELSVAENIFLNEKPTKYGLVDFDAMHFRSKQVLEKIGINTDP